MSDIKYWLILRGVCNILLRTAKTLEECRAFIECLPDSIARDVDCFEAPVRRVDPFREPQP